MLLHFIDLSLLFDGYSTTVLNTHYGYDAAFVSAIEGAKDLKEVEAIIVQHLGLDPKHLTPGSAEIVQWACSMVSGRAAALAACAIAAVVQHTGSDKSDMVDVGLDGR